MTEAKNDDNLMSQNERKTKYNIREWSPKHDKMGKGFTLTNDELQDFGQSGVDDRNLLKQMAAI